VEREMVGRPTWQGHLKLSLVTCPVALFTATDSRGDVHFHLLHPKTHNRVRMIPTDPELGPVSRNELVEGYEYEKGEYVILTEEEIDSVRLESTRTIDIERFVDMASIDRLYWDSPYFLTPDGKLAVEAFSVIREAMARTGKVALGRVVTHQRERLLAIEPHGLGMTAWALRSHNEVRNAADYFDAIPDRSPDPNMVAIAKKIIEQQEGPFDPSELNDRYEDALRALIEEKQAGRGRRVSAPEPEDTNVIDLMAALRQSLGGAKSTAPGRSGAHAPPDKPRTRRRGR
jgi:DNA end-binding protein Ku